MVSITSLITVVASIAGISKALHLTAQYPGSTEKSYVCIHPSSTKLIADCDNSISIRPDLLQIAIEDTDKLLFISSPEGYSYSSSWVTRPIGDRGVGFTMDQSAPIKFNGSSSFINKKTNVIYWTDREDENLTPINIYYTEDS